jgi:DNA invertase Pin-like site-specific DNA recombinase
LVPFDNNDHSLYTHDVYSDPISQTKTSLNQFLTVFRSLRPSFSHGLNSRVGLKGVELRHSRGTEFKTFVYFALTSRINGLQFAQDMTETHPEKRLIGYARVSTYGQTLDAQLEQLRDAGCGSRNIYREKVTGAHSDRRQLLKMLNRLAPGDVVTVTRIDRLARSTFDLFGIVKRIVDSKAQFRSLAEPWADTGTSTGRLMLAVLGGLADVERDLIRTRTAEGRSRAKAQGKHMGRPPSLTPAQQKEAIRRCARGATLQELARSYNVSRATISRLSDMARDNGTRIFVA